MTKLSVTQHVLLTTATKNCDGSLLPLPTSITASRAAVDKSIAFLITSGLAEETEIADSALAWRVDGNLHFSARITEAGRDAIGLVDETRFFHQPQPSKAPVEKKQTKAALLVALLQRDEGVTLDELISATGWLPHTTRAALTGLRKKGHEIIKGKRDDITCYSLVVTA